MMCVMASNWTRLGEKLKAARIAADIEQQQVAASIGVGRGAIGNIEKGKIAKVTPTIRQYAELVGWTEDSPDVVAAGGDPVLRGAKDAPAAVSVQDLALDVQESLRTGPLLQSRVVELETPAGKVRATIVVRGEDGQSPEEQLAALRSLKVQVSVEEPHAHPKE